jgi:hypothetical protein
MAAQGRDPGFQGHPPFCEMMAAPEYRAALFFEKALIAIRGLLLF